MTKRSPPSTSGARPARGRPLEFDRSEALQAALGSFWSQGFERSTASELADAMSIRRSSFYNSFGDREALFREALVAYAGVTPDSAFAALAPGQPVRALLVRVLRQLCRARAADPEHRGCLVVNAIGELVGRHEQLGPHVAGLVERNLAVYERLLSQAVAQGELPDPGDRRAAAGVLMAFVSGLNLLSKVVPQERALWRICREFLDRFGFEAKAAPSRSPSRARPGRRA